MPLHDLKFGNPLRFGHSDGDPLDSFHQCLQPLLLLRSRYQGSPAGLTGRIIKPCDDYQSSIRDLSSKTLPELLSVARELEVLSDARNTQTSFFKEVTTEERQGK